MMYPDDICTGSGTAVQKLCSPAPSLQVRLLRSRRRTMSLEIRPDGTLLVRAPLHAAEADIRHFVTEKQHWIIKHLNALQAQLESTPPAAPLRREDISALADQAMRELPPRVAHYAALIGVTYGRITIRNQKSRWGSCSDRGNLNFNCLLMLAPPAVRDYVIVHELCHRLEMNHSSRFWAQLARILPDYQVQRRWLRENGGMIMRRMTG